MAPLPPLRRLILLAAFLAWMLGSMVVLGVLIVQSRQQTIAAGERLVQSFAQIVEEQSSAVFGSVGRLLRQVAGTLDGLDPSMAADAPAVSDLLRRMIADRSNVASVWVLDGEGRVVYDVGGNFGMNLEDREYFRSLRARPDKPLHVGQPIRSRATGNWLLPVSAPRIGPDGRFAGVLVAALRPDSLERTWSVQTAGGGRSITLFRADSTLLMRSPFVERAMGQRYEHLPLFRDLLPRAPAGIDYDRSPVDGVERQIAYRRFDAYPELVIAATEPIDEVLHPWRRMIGIVAIGAVAAAVPLLALLAWLLREWRRRQQSEARLAAANARLSAEIAERTRAQALADSAHARLMDAVAAFPGSFRLFDAEERLVLSNDVQWITDPVVIASVPLGTPFPAIAARAAALELDRAAVGRQEEWLRERLAQFRDGRTDVEVHWRDDRWFHLLERRTSEGGRISVRLDITRQKRVEEHLRQAQKMEAVGQLTGGIAHDFNNMLTVILGNAELLAERPDVGPEARELARVVMQAADAAADLTSRLLAFARRTPLQPRRVQVTAFVSEMERLLRRTLGEQYDIRLVLTAEIWDVVIDPAQLEAAILNLALNARDAMPDGGPVTIETANVEIDATYAADHEGATAGAFVMVALSDAGCGMEADVVRRAFEPFFTTKGVGRGTGLGLSMVYGFVRQSGGHVKIYSEPGRGTTVRLYLPRATDAAVAPDALPDEPGIPPGEGQAILVVEDDAQVRAHTERQLLGLGYEVVGVPDGAAALTMLSGRPFDLILTDVVMPGGMSGRDVADAAVRLRPGIAVLFMSGYTENAIVHGGQLDPDARLLSKPFRLRDLAIRVRAALAGW
ncbi:hypothetical protein STAQ_42480 [Allostella sp. ATCC 35155]|nr:hypothetical protein STAQ_42480 [Stella sp. ATCC 35155]